MGGCQMQKDKDQRTDQDLEVEEFLSQFESDVDEPTVSFDSYLVNEKADNAGSSEPDETSSSEESGNAEQNSASSSEDTSDKDSGKAQDNETAKGGLFGFLKHGRRKKSFPVPDQDTADSEDAPEPDEKESVPDSEAEGSDMGIQDNNSVGGSSEYETEAEQDAVSVLNDGDSETADDSDPSDHGTEEFSQADHDLEENEENTEAPSPVSRETAEIEDAESMNSEPDEDNAIKEASEGSSGSVSEETEQDEQAGSESDDSDLPESIRDEFESIRREDTEYIPMSSISSAQESSSSDDADNEDMAAGAAYIDALRTAEEKAKEGQAPSNEHGSPVSAAEPSDLFESIDKIDSDNPDDSKHSSDKKKRKVGKARKKSGASETPSKLRRARNFLSLYVSNPDYDPSAGDVVMRSNKVVKNKPKKFSFKHLFRDLVMLLAVLIMAFLVYCFVIISMAPKIDPTDIYDNIQQSSTVYDQNGKAVDSIYYTEDRKIVKYNDLPENLVNAFVALEDKTFWTHHGFNWTRMIGAVFQSLTGSGEISGTSTITQQLARNVYLADTKSVRSIKRKVLEMYYAREIERSLTKKQIITAYLNTIYLGFGNYGVQAAAESYFSTDVTNLSLIQCAALAALPQAPDSYALVQYVGSGDTIDDNDTVIKSTPDKYVCNDESKSRRNTCLNLMLDQGYITKEQHDKVYDSDLKNFIHADLSNSSSDFSYFNEYLIDKVVDDLMDKYDYSESQAEKMVYTGGLKIYSTVDSSAQKVITKEFKNDSNFPSLTGYSTDGNGNIVNDSGGIMLYRYGNFFDGKGNFKLKSDECKVNDDGSLTIKSGYRLNIYTTKSNGDTDYSLEFKPTYVTDGGTLYMYNGGYINIPSKYKSLDDDGNLVISASYFKKYPGNIKVGDSTATITEKGYTLPERTIEPQAAMAVVEVGTGEVKALVGGRKQSGRQLYNRALNPRQSGSSIKPISVYSSALQKSYDYAAKGENFPIQATGHDSQGSKYYGNYLTESSVIVDEPMTFNGQTWPQNSSNSYSGAVTMKKALENSINVCAVKLYLQVGGDYCADLVEKFGITTLDREGSTSDMNAAALALGGLTNGVIPLEMAQAYATFPNGGVRQSSICYTKVTDRDGKVLLTGKSESTKVLDKGVAFIMTDMLKGVVSEGIGSAASVSGVQAGGKTGTTSSEYDIWFDGFTPKYAAALWIGTDVNIQLTSMSGMAAALWGKIMNQIPNALTGTYPSQPDDVVKVGNYYYTDGTQSGLTTYYSEQAAKQKAAAAAKAKKKSNSKSNDNEDEHDDED